MTNKKICSKSVRLTQEVYDYIENFEGEGFNQKLENLVLFCMKEEHAKRRFLALLDKDIKEKHDVLNYYNEVVRAGTKVVKSMNEFNERMESILGKMKI